MFSFVLRKALARNKRSIERTCARAAPFQVGVLRRLLRAASGTEWGRRHDFERLAAEPDVVAAFQRGVAVQRYEAFAEPIARMRAGEPDVLWPGKVGHFAHSSGTTAFPKKIPISREMFAKMVGLGRAMSVFHAEETGSVASFGGMSIGLTGRVQDDPDHPGVRVGEISGLITEYGATLGGLQGRIRRRGTLPRQIKEIEDLYEQLDAIVDHSLNRDVRLLAFPPSWGLILIDRLIARYNERHAARVRTVGQIWPGLGLVICSAMPLHPYREALRERIGLDSVAILEMYGASEGSMAFQCASGDSDMLLHVDNGTFEEFVPLAECDSDRPRRLTLADVRTGVPYVPVLTTCSGLWAYELGDIVEFTSVTPPRLRVLGRTIDYLDSYGENLRGEEARQALAETCARTDARAIEFHLAPTPAGEGRPHAHQWLVEFEQPPANLDGFTRQLDTVLQELSPAYRVCRAERGMGAPEVVPVPLNGFYRYMKERAGTAQIQSKIPCMSDGRDLAEAVLSFIR